MVAIEATIIEYLNDALADVAVTGGKPQGIGRTFVTVEKTGSSRENYVEAAMLAIQSWAPTQAEAMLLNERVKAAMESAPADLPDVYRAHCQTDYNFPDTSTQHWRYQAVFEVSYAAY